MRLIRGLFLIGLGMLAVLRIGSFFYASYIGYPEPEPSTSVTIASGTTSEQAVDLLVKQKVVRSGLEFRVFLSTQKDWQVKAGTYELQPGTSYRLLMTTLALGPQRRESQVRLLEGWSVDDEADYLHKQKNIPLDQTARVIGKSVDRAPFDSALRSDFPFLKLLPKKRSLEGYLMPDTYRVWDDQLPEGLVQKQLKEFQDNFGDIDLTKLPAPLKTLDDVVILASIVEKEVRGEMDQKIVAGIFLSRLNIGMALQTDATLTYGLGNGHVRATSEDLATDSPYNLYKHRDLPPSPICNPGAAAIRAVLNPTDTEYLYFLTDKEGRVLYGRTFDDHIRNRRTAGY